MARQDLVATSPDEVPAELGAAIAEACAEALDVRAAYVCRVRREDDAGVTERLVAGVEPADPSAALGLADAGLLQRLFSALPEEVRPGGVAVLAEAGVAGWRQQGVCVFERS